MLFLSLSLVCVVWLLSWVVIWLLSLFLCFGYGAFCVYCGVVGFDLFCFLVCCVGFMFVVWSLIWFCGLCVLICLLWWFVCFW